MREECHHHADAERALEGTWVIDELRLALEKGYKILEIHEIHDYRVRQRGNEPQPMRTNILRCSGRARVYAWTKIK